MTGLTDQEAQEFHTLFMKGFFIFTVIAIIAHMLVWAWRPWLPGEEGYSMVVPAGTGAESIPTAIAQLSLDLTPVLSLIGA